MAKPKPCTEDDCDRPKKAGHPRWCYWHWLLRQPPDVQSSEAGKRLRAARREDGFLERGRVPEREWPEGHRWCAGCQGYVPLFYVQGSRCRGCNSRANHASHLKRTYGLTAEEYDELLAFQGGRCYVCRQVPRKRRLAVDHDHETGAVRGLLCANDEYGCNVSLRRILGDIEAARALLAYVERSPLERMRAGEAPRRSGGRPSVAEQTRRSVLGTGANVPARSPESAAAATSGSGGSDWTSDPSWAF